MDSPRPAIEAIDDERPSVEFEKVTDDNGKAIKDKGKDSITDLEIRQILRPPLP